MSPTPPTESLRDASIGALLELAGQDPSLVVYDADSSPKGSTSVFGQRYPDRFVDVAGEELTVMAVAAERALAGHVAFVTSPAGLSAGAMYASLRQFVCAPRANVKVVGTHAGVLAGEGAGGPPMLEDIGLMRGLPGMTVVVPADAPTARAATRALHARRGPAYLRLAGELLPTVTDGTFQVGKATELRPGSDLTIVGVGAMLARGLALAEELAQVGVAARVLDFASVKPFDEGALLRAARDTGAILVLEEHSVLTGVGSMVAATTAENYPVPVRRVGLPDIWLEASEPWALLDRSGLSMERIRDEAWELLRARGKVQ